MRIPKAFSIKKLLKIMQDKIPFTIDKDTLHFLFLKFREGKDYTPRQFPWIKNKFDNMTPFQECIFGMSIGAIIMLIILLFI